MTIFVKILGGLGNQMFQYATAKALSIKTGQALLLDNESLKRHQERPFELGHFNISEGVVSFLDYFKLGMLGLDYPLIKVKKHPRYYLEKKFEFNPDVLKFNAPVYLDGYFQSEKYFKDYRSDLLKAFTFKSEMNDNEKKYFSLMKNKLSVSIHIRRGDYISNASASNLFVAQPLSYYENALNLLREKFFNFQVFVFSDDAEWVKHNLKTDFELNFVTGNNGENSFRDLRLMSFCDHHIIANSSFSWWGAWLNQNPEKLVVAPKEWFKDKNKNDGDLIPENWIRI